MLLLLLALVSVIHGIQLPNCNATFCKVLVSNPSQNTITVNTAAVGAGDRICFDTSVTYTKGFVFVNLTGAANNPVVITQCGSGVARLTMNNQQHAIIISGGKNIKISGYTGAPNVYGLQITQSSFGIKIGDGASDIEIEYVEIGSNVGHACISSKSDPNDAANGQPSVTFPQYFRPTFVMRNLNYHHNLLRDCATEAFYIGYFDFEGQVTGPNGNGAFEFVLFVLFLCRRV